MERKQQLLGYDERTRAGLTRRDALRWMLNATTALGLFLTGCEGSLDPKKNDNIAPSNEFAYTASGVTDLIKDGDPQEVIVNDAILVKGGWVNIPTKVRAQKWTCEYRDPDTHERVTASIYEVAEVEQVYSLFPGLQDWGINVLTKEVEKDPKLASGEHTMTIAFRRYKMYPLEDNPNALLPGDGALLIVSSREN